MSLFSAKDYERENKVVRKHIPKSAIDPTKKNRNQKKCSVCKSEAVFILHQGKQSFYLCIEHKKQYEDKDTKHSVEFQKYSIKK